MRRFLISVHSDSQEGLRVSITPDNGANTLHISQEVSAKVYKL